MDLHERFDKRSGRPAAPGPAEQELRVLRARLRHAAGNLVDVRAREHMRTTGTTDYAAALNAVLRADPALRDEYCTGDPRDGK